MWQATIKGEPADATRVLERRGIAYDSLEWRITEEYGSVVIAKVRDGYQPDLALWFSDYSPLRGKVFRPGTLLTFCRE